MKRFTEVTFAIKVNVSLCFTATMFFCLLGELLFKVPLVNLGMGLQMLALSILGGILQFIFFSGECLKRWSFLSRCITFAVLLFPAIAGFAVAFRWFPVGRWQAWAVFLGIFLFIFVAVLVAFEFLFRVTGRRYTNLLGEKQNQK